MTLSLDGLTCSYEDTGSGPPLLFLHGFAQSAYCWREVAARLPGYRCLALDLRGFGDSAKPRDGRYGVRDQADLVMRFLAALELRQAVLVGHSFGGAVALVTADRLLRETASTLRGLALVCSIGFPQRIHWALQVLRLPLVGEAASRLVPAGLAVRTGFRLAYAEARAVTAEMVAAHARCLRLPGARHALLVTARRMAEETVGDLAPEITVPTLVLCGRQDPLVPLAVGERLAAALPSARLEVLEQCGHYPQQEQPAATARLLEEFLGGL